MTLGILILAPLIAAALGWLWWQLPQRQVRKLDISDPKARADVEDNFRKSVGQLLTAIAAALIAGGFAYLQFSQQQRANQIREREVENQKLVDLTTKGFEQLGSSIITVRLSGIYSLEVAMNGSEVYRGPILDALCATIRDIRSLTGAGLTDRLPTDVQSALTVIARRRPAIGSVDLSETNLVGAYLRAAAFGGASLRAANLHNAYLGGADLSSANLSGANLSDSDLSHASLNGANLSGADLSHADLDRANLSDANLSDADLSDANVTQAQLDRACGTGAKPPKGLTLRHPCPKVP